MWFWPDWIRFVNARNSDNNHCENNQVEDLLKNLDKVMRVFLGRSETCSVRAGASRAFMCMQGLAISRLRNAVTKGPAADLSTHHIFHIEVDLASSTAFILALY